MIKVLHIISGLSRSIGGPVSALANLVEQQSLTNTVEPSIFCMSSSDDIDVYQPSCDVTNIHLPDFLNLGFNKRFRWTYAMDQKLKSKIRNCDVVHIHMVWDYIALRSAQIAIYSGKPFIIRPCGNFETWSMSQKYIKKYLYLQLFERYFRLASALHFTTESENKSSISTKSWPCERYIIPVGVDLKKHVAFSRPSTDERSISTKTLLFLGRLHPKKRPDVVLRTLAKLKIRYSLDFKARFVGSGSSDYISFLQALAIDLGVERDVVFVGHLDSGSVTQELEHAGVFVLPSYQENLSVATIEALSTGLPVIVSDKVAIQDLIRKYGAGQVMGAEDEDFCDQIRIIFRDNVQYRRLSRSARKLAFERFSIAANSKEIERMYSKVLDLQSI